MRVVLDANVLIAAVAGRGLCESVLELCLEEHDLVVSEELLDEVRRTLVRRIRLPEAVALDFCRLLRRNAILANPMDVSPDACRDPKDIYLLGLAQSVRAEMLVTGDKDLLESAWGGTTRIVTPRQFWDRCREP
jgi:putative PIN family toxin of toxin-antitoxin system